VHIVSQPSFPRIAEELSQPVIVGIYVVAGETNLDPRHAISSGRESANPLPGRGRTVCIIKGQGLTSSLAVGVDLSRESREV
jgi:hypothetical protein